MALGAAGLAARRMRWPPTSTPWTRSTSLKSDGSTMSTSRNSTSARPGTGFIAALLALLRGVLGLVAGLALVGDEVAGAPS